MVIKVKITDELIEHLGKLAKLRLKREEIESLKVDMESILEYMKLLDDVDAKRYEAMRGPFEEEMKPRKDEVRPFEASKVLKGAPNLQDNLIKVSSIHGQ